jgi:carboxyl-terminal processing protease
MTIYSLSGKMLRTVPLHLIVLSCLTVPILYAEESAIQAEEFSDSMKLVKDVYVDPVKDGTLFEGAMRGMLEQLDPHSTYLNEKEYQELKARSDGEFSGVGLEVVMKKSVIYVVTPIDGSPAKKAGILSGDYIVKIDDQAVTGMSLDQAVDLMRGKAGTSVHLVIAREGQKDPINVDLIRGPIDLESVSGEILDKSYGYLRISSFQAETAKKLDVLLTQLAKQTPSGKLSGIILDLRNNPGGLLDSAVEVSDLFLDVNKVPYNKVIVTTKGRTPESDSVEKVTSSDRTGGVPMVVLINHGTASAAEIVAAALQDDNRAILVGTRSFGKGSVQTIFPLIDGKTAVKITTARYYTPKGTPIQAVGIMPDVPVEQAKVSDIKEESNFVDSESSLQGHLSAEKGGGLPIDESFLDKDSKPLVKTDFQLYQALMVLKGTASLRN